jgi:hypothetical protein
MVTALLLFRTAHLSKDAEGREDARERTNCRAELPPEFACSAEGQQFTNQGNFHILA